ncbi:hypothetical protein ON010_g6257 [Phytophthora cinnamomi]|nr:hypothetical protein ON010_g6257 [Phytophthora cinnamomi]
MDACMLAPDADIVHCVNFEKAVVKVLAGDAMLQTEGERATLEPFKLVGSAVVPEPQACGASAEAPQELTLPFGVNDRAHERTHDAVVNYVGVTSTTPATQRHERLDPRLCRGSELTILFLSTREATSSSSRCRSEYYTRPRGRRPKGGAAPTLWRGDVGRDAARLELPASLAVAPAQMQMHTLEPATCRRRRSSGESMAAKSRPEREGLRVIASSGGVTGMSTWGLGGDGRRALLW